jgi:hypothetical protein
VGEMEDLIAKLVKDMEVVDDQPEVNAKQQNPDSTTEPRSNEERESGKVNKRRAENDLAGNAKKIKIGKKTFSLVWIQHLCCLRVF